MHHSEERYLELLDSFKGVTETYHLTSLTVSLEVTAQFHLVLLDRITWRYWTVSPGINEPHHLMLLDSFTWHYWTVSPGITGPHHLTLLDSFTCHYWSYWTVSPCVTETYHLTLQDSNWAVQYAMTNSLICDCFFKWSLSTWQISQWHSKISWYLYLANNWQIKRALPALVSVMSRLHHSPFITFLNFRESWLIFKYRILQQAKKTTFSSFCFAWFCNKRILRIINAHVSDL